MTTDVLRGSSASAVAKEFARKHLGFGSKSTTPVTEMHVQVCPFYGGASEHYAFALRLMEV